MEKYNIKPGDTVTAVVAMKSDVKTETVLFVVGNDTVQSGPDAGESFYIGRVPFTKSTRCFMAKDVIQHTPA